jgi:LPS export ABC transporter protein LptC
MIKQLLEHIKIAMVFFTIAFFIQACTNDVKEVHELTQTSDFPLRLQYNVHYEYSDSARKQIDIKAAEALDFTDVEPAYIEFSKGIQVNFYTRTGEQEAFLKANYAKFLPDENLWEARGNVVVINSKKEELNSEELIWDQNQKLIYSTQFVKIITPESILTGEGFEADQNFSKWKITGSSGSIDIDEELEENETEEN